MNKLETALAIVILLATAASAPVRAAARQAPGDATIVDDDTGAEGDEHAAALPASERALLSGFETPTVAATPAANLDPQHVVPADLLRDALAYYQQNAARIANKDYLTVVDFSRTSTQPRMFIVDMKSGAVQAVHVAHGSGSDPRNTGRATVFSNEDGSNCSSLGYYLTAETYDGKHGYSCRMDGLSTTNSNVRERAVVIHGADYVHDSDVKQGRSWGCFALAMTMRTSVIDRLKGGSLIYAGRSQGQ